MKLLAVAIVALSVVLVCCSVSQAATRTDAIKAQWYLRGEGDVILPTLGQVITDLSCVPAKGKYVACKLRSTTTDYKKALCSTGRFYIKDQAPVGQWAKPKPCLTS